MTSPTKALPLYLYVDPSDSSQYIITDSQTQPSAGDSTISEVVSKNNFIHLYNQTGTSQDLEFEAQQSNTCLTCRARSGVEDGSNLSLALLDTLDTLVVTIGGATTISIPATSSASTINVNSSGAAAHGALTSQGTVTPVVFCSTGFVTVNNNTSNSVDVVWGSQTRTIPASTSKQVQIDDAPSVTVAGTNFTVVHQDQHTVTLSDWPTGMVSGTLSTGVDTKFITASDASGAYTINIIAQTTDSIWVNSVELVSTPTIGESYSYTLPSSDDQFQAVSVAAGVTGQLPSCVADLDDPWILVKHGPANCKGD